MIKYPILLTLTTNTPSPLIYCPQTALPGSAGLLSSSPTIPYLILTLVTSCQKQDLQMDEIVTPIPVIFWENHEIKMPN